MLNFYYVHQLSIDLRFKIDCFFRTKWKNISHQIYDWRLTEMSKDEVSYKASSIWGQKSLLTSLMGVP